MWAALSVNELLAATIVASTPLLLASIGELVVEKSGVLNLGVEGMMIVGALCAVMVAITTGNHFYAIAASIVGGAALAMVFAFLTQLLTANQVAAGLAIALFGVGATALFGQPFSGAAAQALPLLRIPVLADIPVVGDILFRNNVLFYLSIVLAIGVGWFLRFTRWGLILKAVGENPEAAHAVGFPVIAIRIAAIAFGGAMAGMAGAALSLVQIPIWVEGLKAQRGWIALAIVVFAGWKVWRCVLGAYIFGGVSTLQFNLQAAGSPIPSQYLLMLPYLATIFVLVLISADKYRAKFNAPGSLGRPFRATA